MRNNGRIIRQLIGPQLGILRIKKNKTLAKVAKETNIPLNIVDNIESGQSCPWVYYRGLLKYYQYKIGIVPDKESS